MGITTASTSRYPVVSHWTVEVLMENSSIRVGKVTFMAVSITTPVKDSNPAATMDRNSRASARRTKVLDSFFTGFTFG